MSSETIACADIGGTNARFALADISNGRVAELRSITTFPTKDFPDFASAWRAFGDSRGKLPNALAISFAGPVESGRACLTNGRWELNLASLPSQLGAAQTYVVNDFVAVAHAVANAQQEHFLIIAKGAGETASRTTIVGPGTGLGVASLTRCGGSYLVQASEGGHAAFAPLNAFEQSLQAELLARHGRVSIERIVSGPGIVPIYSALNPHEGEGSRPKSDVELWSGGLSGANGSASSAVDRFCALLGSASGDLALVHGSSDVVIAGGVGTRLASRLPQSLFLDRFYDKGRMRARMERMSVRVFTHPAPGLFGAAAAFTRRKAEGALSGQMHL